MYLLYAYKDFPSHFISFISNEDTRANTTQPIAEEDARTADSFLNMSGDADEEDDDFAPPPNQQQHVPVRILKLYAW